MGVGYSYPTLRLNPNIMHFQPELGDDHEGSGPRGVAVPLLEDLNSRPVARSRLMIRSLLLVGKGRNIYLVTCFTACLLKLVRSMPRMFPGTIHYCCSSMSSGEVGIRRGRSTKNGQRTEKW